MRVHREPLLILAGNAMTRGDILGGLPHRDIGVVKLIRPRLPIEGEARIGREVEAALRHHRHAFDATRDEGIAGAHRRSEEHTSELQSLLRISYAVFCLETTN